jgi:hypothetical protein
MHARRNGPEVVALDRGRTKRQLKDLDAWLRGAFPTTEKRRLLGEWIYSEEELWRGKTVVVGFRHHIAIARRGVNQSLVITPEWQKREWRYEKVNVGYLQIPLPPALKQLPDPDGVVRCFDDLCNWMIARFDSPVRFRDTWYSRAPTHPILRGPEKAALFAEAIKHVRQWHADLAEDPAGTIERMRAIIAAEGFEIRPGVYGPMLAYIDAPPLDPEIPAWLVKEEIKRLLPVFEHDVERKLTRAEIDSVVREAAEERLRAMQNRFGRSLAARESAKRSARRRRQSEGERRAHTRIAPTPSELVLDFVRSHPGFTVKETATGLHMRPAMVQALLAEHEADGRLRVDRTSRAHRYEVIEPVRVEPSGIRIGDAHDDDRMEEEAAELPRKTKAVR